MYIILLSCTAVIKGPCISGSLSCLFLLEKHFSKLQHITICTMAARSLPEKYISVDVECVATGIRHDAHSVALVAVVDQDERVLLKKKVKQTQAVVSYLTPLTGIRAGDLDDGEPLESVLVEVKRLLGPDVVLVGQGINSDVTWLHLRQGEDFQSTVDLGDVFKTFNPRYSNYSVFTLSHEANTLLGRGTVRLG